MGRTPGVRQTAADSQDGTRGVRAWPTRPMPTVLQTAQLQARQKYSKTVNQGDMSWATICVLSTHYSLLYAVWWLCGSQRILCRIILEGEAMCRLYWMKQEKPVPGRVRENQRQWGFLSPVPRPQSETLVPCIPLPTIVVMSLRDTL